MAVAIKRPERERPPATEHFDVLILGAGLSGIGAACHLRRAFPGKSLAILEAQPRRDGRDLVFGVGDGGLGLVTREARSRRAGAQAGAAPSPPYMLP